MKRRSKILLLTLVPPTSLLVISVLCCGLISWRTDANPHANDAYLLREGKSYMVRQYMDGAYQNTLRNLPTNLNPEEFQPAGVKYEKREWTSLRAGEPMRDRWGKTIVYPDGTPRRHDSRLVVDATGWNAWIYYNAGVHGGYRYHLSVLAVQKEGGPWEFQESAGGMSEITPEKLAESL